MRKEVIAVDIDEVLFPFMPEFTAYHNKYYGTQLVPEDFFSYAFEDVIEGQSVPQVIERVYAFTGSDHNHVVPIAESQAALAKLIDRFDLAVITARHPQFAEHTKYWLDQHFDGHFTSLNFIGYAPVMEKPRTKAEVCKEIGALALIDDSVGHVSRAVQAGIKGILFGDYAWNRADELPENVVRCEDWAAVLEYFDGRDG